MDMITEIPHLVLQAVSEMIDVIFGTKVNFFLVGKHVGMLRI